MNASINRVNVGVVSANVKKKSRRLLRFFAIFAAAIMLLSVLPAVTGSALAEIERTLEPKLIDELTENNYSSVQTERERTDVNAVPPPPGTVSSVTNPIEPIISTIGNAYAPMQFTETELSYEYNTSFGRYLFPKDAPYKMQVISYVEENGTVMSEDLVKSSEFFVRSELDFSYEKYEVIEATEESLIVRRQVMIDNILFGYLETTVNFFEDKAPKITAKLTLIINQKKDIGISWKIIPSDYLCISDDVDKYSLDNLTYLPPSESLDLITNERILELSLSSTSGYLGNIDWSDANAGDAKLINNESISIVIDFPENVFLIDPTIIGTSTLCIATPGTPHRNSFYAQGYYWVFWWYSGKKIAYARSTDGITWPLTQYLPDAPGNIYDPSNPRDHLLDVAIYTEKYLWIVTRGGATQLFSLRCEIALISSTDEDDWEILTWGSNEEKFFNAVITGNENKIYYELCFVEYNPSSNIYSFHIWNTSSDSTLWWVAATSPFPDAGTDCGSYIAINGMTAVRLTDFSIRIIITYNKYHDNGIHYADYYPNFNSYSALHWVYNSDPPYEFSPVGMSDGSTVYAAGRISTTVGWRYLYIWKFEGNGSYEVIGPLDDRSDLNSHGWADDPHGRCSLSKDNNDGLYLFYWSYDEASDLYNLYYRYKVTPDASWSEEQFIFGPYNYRYTTAVEISGDITFASCVGAWTGSGYNICFISLPTMAKILASTPDVWALPGLNADQPQDSDGSISVSPGNGQLFVSEVDISATGRMLDLSIGRTYSMPKYFIKTSSGDYEPYIWAQSPICDLSDGWQLDLPWLDNCFVYWWSGQKYLIEWDEDTFENKHGDMFTLTRSGTPATYILTTLNGGKYTFNSDGKLTEIQQDYSWNNDNSTKITFAYSGPNDMLNNITDTLGRVATFSYDDSERLSNITYIGQKIVYEYDGSGRLQNVTHALNRTTSYEYNSTFTDFPLLQSRKIPEGAKTELRYTNETNSLKVGTEAISKLVVQKTVYNLHGDGGYDYATVYYYWSEDGNIFDARLRYTGSVTTYSNITKVEYLMDSDTNSLTVVWRDEDLNELKRIRNWYSSTGRINKVDTYVPGSDSIIESTDYIYLDEFGNPEYHKDATGYETFSSYGNSEHSNVFYQPGKAELISSGKGIIEDFNDRDISDWSIIVGSSSDAVFFQNLLPGKEFSLDIVPDSGHFGMSHAAYSPDRVLVDFEILFSGHIERVDFRLVNDSISYPMGMISIDPSDQYSFKFWHHTTNIYVGQIDPDVMRRVTLYWDYGGTGELKIYIDGDLIYSATRTDTDDDIRSVYIWAEQNDYPVYWDNIYVSNGQDITLKGMDEDARAYLLDNEGNIVARNITTSGQAVLHPDVPTDAYPYGSIIVRNMDDTFDGIIDSREICGGDIYSYDSVQRYNATIEKTEWNYLLNIESIWPAHYLWNETSFDEDISYNFQWVTDDIPIEDTYCHQGANEPGSYISEHYVIWNFPSLTAASYNDIFLQYVLLPSGEYPLQILIGAKTERLSGDHTTYLSWGANLFPIPDVGSHRVDMGTLPAPDQWHALIFKARDHLGIGTVSEPAFGPLEKLSFIVIGGSAYWDYTRWIDGTSAPWPYIKLTNLPADDVENVKLYDMDHKLLYTDSTISSNTAELWCYSNPTYGTFPIKGYFLIEFEDGTKVKTDVREFFAGDEFEYQQSNDFFLNSEILDPSSNLSTCYSHILLGSFSKKGSDYENDYSLMYNKYGNWDSEAESWDIPSRLVQSNIKQGGYWTVIDYEYGGPYLQLTKTKGPYNPSSPSSDPCRVVTENIYDSNWAYVVESRTYHQSGGTESISQQIWDTAQDMLMGMKNPRGYWTVVEYDEVGRPILQISPELALIEDEFDVLSQDWTIVETGGDVGLDASLGCEESPSLKLQKTQESGGAWVYQEITVNSDYLIADMNLRLDSITTDPAFLYILHGGMANVYMQFLSLNGEGSIRYYDTYWHELPYKYSANEWFNMTLVIDRNAKQYDIYINGILQAEDAGFYYNTTTLDGFRLQSGYYDSGLGPILRADDIRVVSASSSVEYQYEYDENEKLWFTKIRDQNDNWITKVWHDGYGRTDNEERLNDQGGVYSRASYDYDWNGHITKMKMEDASNEAITYTYYDSLGRAVKEVNPDSTYRNIAYDDAKHMVTATDEEGRQKTIISDIFNRVSSVSQGSGNDEIGIHYEYDSAGNLIRAIDPVLEDNFNELSQAWMILTTGGEAGLDNDTGCSFLPSLRLYKPSTENDVWAQRAITVDANQYVYANMNIQIDGTKTDPAWMYLSDAPIANVLMRFYLGKVSYYDKYLSEYVDIADYELGQWLKMHYVLDLTNKNYDIYIDGELVGSDAPFYQGTSSINRVVFRTGNVSNSAGPVMRADDILIWEDKGVINYHEYDHMGRLTKSTFAYGDYETYSYDAMSRLVTKRMRDGLYEYHDYDQFGRLDSIAYGQSSGGPAQSSLGSMTYTYDENGNVLTANRTNLNDYTVNLTYTYDINDSILSEQYLIDATSYTTTYGYDKKGNLIAIDYPYYEQFVTYERDWYDRIVTVYAQHRSYTVPFAQFEYDGLDRITSIDYYSGETTTYTYDSMTERLNSVETMLDQETILLLDYTYDDSGRITDVTDEHYVYDSVGRLTYANGPWGTRNYTYDSLGNRIQMNVDSGSEIVAYSYDNADNVNQLTSIDSTSDELDRDYYYIGGCVDWVDYNVGDDWIFTYESDGLLSEIQIGEDTSGPYCYDAFSRKVIYDNWYYVYMGDALLYDQFSSECKIYADGMLIGFTDGSKKWSYYAHCDHLGSVRVVTKWSGQIAFSGRYEPFGRLWVDDGYTNLRYLGKIQDEYSGLYCLGIRFYDPEIGRFIQEDPVLGSLSEPLTLNRWVYCANDPVNFKDITGRWLNIAIGALVGFVASTVIYSLDVALTDKEWDWGEFATEAVIGTISGAVAGALFNPAAGMAVKAMSTSGSKLGMNVASKGIKVAGKVIGGVMTGGATGASSYLAEGGITIAQGKDFDFSFKELGKRISIGALAGAIAFSSGKYISRLTDKIFKISGCDTTTLSIRFFFAMRDKGGQTFLQEMNSLSTSIIPGFTIGRSLIKIFNKAPIQKINQINEISWYT